MNRMKYMELVANRRFAKPGKQVLKNPGNDAWNGTT